MIVEYGCSRLEAPSLTAFRTDRDIIRVVCCYIFLFLLRYFGLSNLFVSWVPCSYGEYTFRSVCNTLVAKDLRRSLNNVVQHLLKVNFFSFRTLTRICALFPLSWLLWTYVFTDVLRASTQIGCQRNKCRMELFITLFWLTMDLPMFWPYMAISWVAGTTLNKHRECWFTVSHLTATSFQTASAQSPLSYSYVCWIPLTRFQ